MGMRARWKSAVSAVLSILAASGVAQAADEDAPDNETFAPQPVQPPDGPPPDAPPPDQTAPGDDATAAQSAPVRRGLIFSGSMGLSDCFGEICSRGDDSDGVMANTRMALGLDLSGWYRPMPLLSLGLALHGNFLGIRDKNDYETDGTISSIDIGGRVHPIQTGIVDAYGGIGVGLMMVSLSTSGGGYVTNSSWHAWDVALHGGAEVYLTPRISAGGMLKLTIPFWNEICDDYEGPTRCGTPTTQSDELLPSVYWYLGGSVSIHLGSN